MANIEKTVVVCLLATKPLKFADNVIGQCSRCGEAVQHRAYVPEGAELVCFLCLLDDPDIRKINLSPETVRELKELAKRRRHKEPT